MERNNTVTELKNYIRSKAREYNQAIAEYRQNVREGKTVLNPMLEKEINRLSALGTGKRGAGKREITTGLKGKTKEQLFRQAKAFEKFEEIDYFTPRAERVRSERAMKAYKEFKYNYIDEKLGQSLTYEQWEEMTNIFASLSTSILNQFGYGAGEDDIREKSGTDGAGKLANTYVEYLHNPKKGVNFYDEVLKLTKYIKGKGLTPREVADLLYDRVISK